MSKDGNNLMPIGRFSACCRLSVKALRHYVEQGLLTPAYIDPVTAYRYYRRDQARDAVTIAMLRSLDISIATIRALLNADDKRLRDLLDTERARIEGDLARKQQALHSIGRIRKEGVLLPV